MRVAIVTYGRTGSTSLFNYIQNSLQLHGINEPYNTRVKRRFTEQDIWEKNLIVVKFMFPDTKFINKIQKTFDKIIYLTRENHKEAAESHAHSTISDKWDKKYAYEAPPADYIDHYIIVKTEQKEFINSLGGFQVTYEEIYYRRTGIARINKYLNINDSKFINILDLKNKYRQRLYTKNKI